MAEIIEFMILSLVSSIYRNNTGAIRLVIQFSVSCLENAKMSQLMGLQGLERRRQWHPTPVLLPGKSHGWRSCSPWCCLESDTTERLHFHFSLSCIGEGNGNPLQCSCLENPKDGGAWWAAVYGVAQSRTWLKRLSSSSSSGCEVLSYHSFYLYVDVEWCWMLFSFLMWLLAINVFSLEKQLFKSFVLF